MKIFIIDDEEVSLFLTQRILILCGFKEEVHLFLSAEKALDLIKGGVEEELPDLILLDVNMPVMSGWEFLQSFTPIKEGMKKKCSIYILTSSLDFSDEEEAKKIPIVSGLIHKPINKEKIEQIMGQW